MYRNEKGLLRIDMKDLLSKLYWGYHSILQKLMIVFERISNSRVVCCYLRHNIYQILHHLPREYNVIKELFFVNSRWFLSDLRCTVKILGLWRRVYNSVAFSVLPLNITILTKRPIWSDKLENDGLVARKFNCDSPYIVLNIWLITSVH